MPLVDIQLIKGVFDDSEKRQMIEKVTDTMVAIISCWRRCKGNSGDMSAPKVEKA